MKIEIIPQMGKEDCGAACVSMILTNYFNKNISICEIRPIIKNTNEGTSFGDLKNGFEKMGILSNLFEVVKKTEAFLEMSVPIITQIITDDKLY
ncbi:cysteine peptidase family C39 domain-containing protein, partial [Enterococcus gallinarum]|uniref:cysteine peptidase family C39 domain-containing protein n=1 Tax=Enterococcus gallinarum TaxID=1353 RepID=UPI0027DED38B